MPYYDRAEIENGALDGQKLEICWLRDPFDAFSIQIQGSARVRLEDGTILRVNYDGHNGHPYAAVGRILMEQYGVPPEQMSMERIRQWMLANPELAAKVRQSNPSFVFFRVTGLSDQGEAVGAQGVPLSPGRSIAVDKLHVYGTPFFIQADLPINSDKPVTKFRRLMIAQDTGSAINGPARADLYWGAGDTAGRIAGRIRQQGQFVMLLPRELDMVEAGRHTPLPEPKPPIPQQVATKEAAPEPGERWRCRRAQGLDPQVAPAAPADVATAGADKVEVRHMSLERIDKRRHRRRLSEDEHRLWNGVIRSIVPLKRKPSAPRGHEASLAGGESGRRRPPAAAPSRRAPAAKPTANPAASRPTNRRRRWSGSTGGKSSVWRAEPKPSTRASICTAATKARRTRFCSASCGAPRRRGRVTCWSSPARASPTKRDSPRDAACSSGMCRSGCGCRNSGSWCSP